MLKRLLQPKSLLLALVIASPTTIASESKVEKIDQLTERYHQYEQFNGALLVVDDGKVLFKKAYGLADQQWSVANTTDTKFRIGSLTKSFTAMLILQLVDEGKLSLSGKLSDYLPYYRKDTGSKVTIAQLLNHTAGIPSFTSMPNYPEISRQPAEPKAFIEAYCSDDLAFEPGSDFAYSNGGYYILGGVIEQVTGKTFAQVLEQRILKPAKMFDSGVDVNQKLLTKRASGYKKRGTDLSNAEYIDMSVPFSAGNLYSTVEDLYKLDRLLYTEKLLPEKLKQQMFTPNKVGYGFGWAIYNEKFGEDSKPVKMTAHSGAVNGFAALLIRMIDDDRTVILLHNNGMATNLGAVATGISNILYDQPFEWPKKSIADEIYQLLKSQSVEKVQAQYRKLLKNSSDDYNFSPHEMNSLGYLLLSEQLAEQAIGVFQLNVETHPENANAHDSLAEAYMKNGQKAKAIASYKKSFALNPKNTNAEQMIKKLQK